MSSVLINFYSEGNSDNGAALNNNIKKAGQSFAVSNNFILDSCEFYMRKSGSPTGNAHAKIYAHSGTYGTSSLPTGTALAVSGALDVSTISGVADELKTFTFSGVNKITLNEGTNYVLTIEYEDGTAVNYIIAYYHEDTPTHSGNYCQYISSWSSYAVDLCFYVYGEIIKPQGTIVDSYNESNSDGGFVGYLGSVGEYQAMSFTNINQVFLDNVKLYLKKDGLPTGTINVRIYAHSGTYGVDSVPTGSALATSENFDVSTLPADGVYKLVTFNFINTQRIVLTPSTKYEIVTNFGVGDLNNKIGWGVDVTSPSHSGVFAYKITSGGAWGGGVAYGYDMCFYVYAGVPSIPMPTATTLLAKTKRKEKRYLFLIDGDNGVQKEATEKWDFDSITRSINGTMSVSIRTNKTLDTLSNSNIVLNDAVTIRCSTAETGANGLDYFSGYINQQNIDINDKGETVNLSCLGHISKLYQAIWRNGTTIVQNYTASGADPQTIIKAIIDNYRTLDSRMRVNYSTTSTETVGATAKDKFELVTFGDALERVVNLAYTASRVWFYRVLGDNIFTFKKASLSADHIFTLGKDISDISISQDLNNSVDEVFLYYNNTALRRYKNTSNITSYGYRSKQLRETNVPDTTTADAIGNAVLSSYAPPVLKITIRINNAYSKGIELVDPGSTCQVLNAPTSIVNLLTTNMLITKTTYYKDYVDCELTITHPRVENEIDNIRRSFAKSQTEGMPVTTYTDV